MSGSDTWMFGLRQFQTQNYYYAREIWLSMLHSTEDIGWKARLYNSLGAVQWILYGHRDSITYFQQAERLGQQIPEDKVLRTKYLLNIATVMSELDYFDVAVRNARQLIQYLDVQSADESLYAIEAYLHVMIRYELYEEYTQELSTLTSFLNNTRQKDTASHDVLARTYYLLGQAYQCIRQYESSLEPLRKSLSIHKTPMAQQALATSLLELGELDEAVRHVEPLYQLLWGYERDIEYPEWAEIFMLIGTLAQRTGHPQLAKRAWERSELYFGRTLRWRQWSTVRRWLDKVASIPSNTDVHPVQWSDWNTLLDGMSLVDTIESMYPRIYRWSVTASRLAVQIVKQLPLESPEPARTMIRSSAHLAYLGLTAMASTEEEAMEILENPAHGEQICVLGAQLLDACSITREVQQMVRLYRGSFQTEGTYSELLAACLGIAMNYVEEIELHNQSHVDAVQTVLSPQYMKFPKQVQEAFRLVTNGIPVS